MNLFNLKEYVNQANERYAHANIPQSYMSVAYVNELMGKMSIELLRFRLYHSLILETYLLNKRNNHAYRKQQN